MPTISEAIQGGASTLQNSGIDEARREAASLLAFVLKKDRTFLIAHPEYELLKTEREQFTDAVRRRAKREPLQHIKGTQEFYGLDFEVNPGVLIPRPETEIIVENAIDLLSRMTDATFCEVGVGSGCIAVSILKNVASASAVGLDVSPDALLTATRNADFHGVSDRLKLIRSDVYEELDERRFDLIVSNPPYIPAADIAGLQPEVRDFEPLNALTDGSNGLSIITEIITDSPRFLRSAGSLLLEIGFGQAEAVNAMFSTNIWETVEVIPDLQGIPRTFKAKLK